MSILTSLRGFKEILSFNNRFELILHHLFRGDNELCVYRFSDYQVVMLKSGGDLNGMRACVATSQYKQFFKQMKLTHALRVLDLGAHTGGFIFSLLSSGHTVAQSLSVEQNQQTQSRLAFNMVLNRLENRCEAIHAAVWSEQTSSLLSSTGAGKTSGKVTNLTDPAISDSRLIRGFTVNQLLARLDDTQLIDICKIDVEGAEWKLFSKLENCNGLSERCRYLIIEIHPSSEPTQTLMAIIEDLGFQLVAECQNGDQTYLYKNVHLLV